MLFKQKQKPLLKHAIRMVYCAIGIAYKYKQDNAYIPTPEDLKRFGELDHALWECYCTAGYISRCMGQRFAGRDNEQR